MTTDLSVVVAVYNEDPHNLVLLLKRLEEVLGKLPLTYEVVFVNDGSKERTSKALRQIALEVPYVKLVSLSRNFGQQAAITAGLDHSDGKAIVNIDSDLQDPPELIPQMLELWRRGYDVVYATRSTRKDHLTKRLSAYLFYRLLSSVSSVPVPRDTGDFRLMDRKVVDALARLPEKTRFLRGLVPWLGFRQVGIPVDRGARERGESTYTLRKLLQLAMDGLLSLSLAPLYMIPVLGAFLFSAGMAGTAISTLIMGISSPLFPLVLTLSIVSALAGIQLACLGLVAMYLSTALIEVRGRPTYLVGEKIGRAFGADQSSGSTREKDRELTGVR